MERKSFLAFFTCLPVQELNITVISSREIIRHLPVNQGEIEQWLYSKSILAKWHNRQQSRKCQHVATVPVVATTY
jgi:hypothetical protein